MAKVKCEPKPKVLRRGIPVVICLSIVVFLFLLFHSSFAFPVGDVNHDGLVDLSDAVLLALAYNSHNATSGLWVVGSSWIVGPNWVVDSGVPASVNWNVGADINGDGTISLADAVLLAINYGGP